MAARPRSFARFFGQNSSLEALATGSIEPLRPGASRGAKLVWALQRHPGRCFRLQWARPLVPPAPSLTWLPLVSLLRCAGCWRAVSPLALAFHSAPSTLNRPNHSRRSIAISQNRPPSLLCHLFASDCTDFFYLFSNCTRRLV